MLSAFPAIFPTEPMSGNPIMSHEDVFLSWDWCSDTVSEPILSSETVKMISSSCSDDSNVLDPVPRVADNNNSNSSSNNDVTVMSNSGSDDGDERKRKRRLSNRESAKRSRMRKQKHLENLREESNRLRVANRELEDRVRVVLFHDYILRAENERLQSEYTMLRLKLSDMQHMLLLRKLQQAWPCDETIYKL